MAALSGMSITCAYTGLPTFNQSAPPLLSLIAWQEAPATGTATTNTVPGQNASYGPCVIEVYATANSWLSYGPAPDSAGSKRVFVPATTRCDFIVNPGDKAMWVADT